MYRILYVDDEPALLEIGKLFLEQRGLFIVDTITSAPAALDLLNTKNYDALISDYQMPEMDGIELLKTIRSSGNHIPFILFTGRGREEVVIQALNEGADFYLQKGGDLESQFTELSNKIRYAVMRRCAEESLKQNEAHLRQIIDLVPHMIFAKDGNGNFLLANRAVAQRYNVNVADLVGNPQAMFHGNVAELQRMLDDDREVMTTATTKFIPEEPYIDAFGHHRILQTTKVPFTTIGNNQQAVLGVAIDITERKEAETELRAAYEQISAQEEELRGQYDEMATLQQRTAESQQILTQVLNTVPVRVFWKDTDLRYVGCNKPFVRDAGFSDPADLIGKTDFDMGWREQADMYRADDRKVIDTGIPKIGYVEPQTAEDGNRTWLRTNKVPLRDPGGNVIGVLGTYEDITEYKRAEESLLESEQRYRNVVEDQTEFISRFLPDGTHIFVNEAYCRYFGLKRDKILGYRFQPKIPVDDQERVKRFFVSLTPDHPIDIIEHRIIMPDGTMRWQRWSDRAIFDSSETVTEYQSVGRDITEVKATQTALEKSEIRFREQYQSNPLAIFTWQYREDDFVLVDCNRTAEILSGGRSHDYLGVIASEFYATRPELVNEIRKCFSEQSVFTKELRSEHFLPGRLITATAAFVPPDLIMVHMEDITERKQAEEALRESQRMLAEAMDLANLVTWECDIETGVLTFDDRFSTLYGTNADRKGVYQMTAEAYIRDIVLPEDLDVLVEEDEKTRKTTDPHYVSKREYRVIRGDGEIRHIEMCVGVTKDAKGRTIKTHGVNHDITERKQAEEALRRANRQLSLLSGITRHDILNKITGILGYLKLAEMKFNNPALDVYLRKMESATTEIQSQIEFTRIYQDLGTNEPQWIELDTVMPRTYVPATIFLNADVRGVMVFADPMLGKMFFNLLDNSIRHGQRVTEIRVSCQKSGDDLVVVWEDNGIGIAADEKERIFERGFGANTGLGMFLIREILSLTGITIKETGTPGKGARFEITVPNRQYRFAYPQSKNRLG